MLCDCHIHTCFSGDSETPVRAQLDRAVALGIETVCITDHHDWDAPEKGGDVSGRFVLDFPSYLPTLQALREEYRGSLTLLIGVELGMQLHTFGNTEAVLSRWGDQFDFIIGSNHFVDHYDVFYPEWFTMQPDGSRGEEVSPEQERTRYRHFFEVSLERIRRFRGCFDSLGHLDFVVRYGPGRNTRYSHAAYADVLDPILEELIRTDTALEVNTGGFKYGLGHPNPQEDILMRYRALGGRLITIGSDAHIPEHVGYEFEKTAELLKAIGFQEYAVYRNRIPQMRGL